jgi:hypothetical protein
VWPQCRCSQDNSSFIISWSLSKRTLINTRVKSTLPGNHYHCAGQQFSESRRCLRYGNTIHLLVRNNTHDVWPLSRRFKNSPVTHKLSITKCSHIKFNLPGIEQCQKEIRQGMNLQHNTGEFEWPLLQWKRNECYIFWMCACSPVIQQAKHMRCIIVSSVDCLARPYFLYIIS